MFERDFLFGHQIFHFLLKLRFISFPALKGNKIACLLIYNLECKHALSSACQHSVNLRQIHNLFQIHLEHSPLIWLLVLIYYLIRSNRLNQKLHCHVFIENAVDSLQNKHHWYFDKLSFNIEYQSSAFFEVNNFLVYKATISCCWECKFV